MKTSYSLGSGPKHRSRQPIEIAMTPMIDVIFQLLVFFLATSSFQMAEKLLPSNVSQPIPSSGPSDELPPPEKIADLVDQVIVRLQGGPDVVTVVFNGKPLLGWEELRSKFQDVAKVQASVPVIMDPEPAIPASDVVRAYDLARTTGLSNVYFATRSRP